MNWKLRLVLVALLAALAVILINMSLSNRMAFTSWPSSTQQRLGSWNKDGVQFDMKVSQPSDVNQQQKVDLNLKVDPVASVKKEEPAIIQKPRGEISPIPGKPYTAAMVVLIRNGELDDMVETMKVFEQRFNRHFKYPWIFLNDVPFTEEFKTKILATVTRGVKVHFGIIPMEHWSYPPWINQTTAAETRVAMKDIIYGGSESYRFMCHYQSGYFFQHPLFEGLDYYWRVEPGTRLLCDVPNDPFAHMHKNDIKYGFTIAISEYRETVKTLWKTTMDYVEKRRARDPNYNPELLKFFEDNNKDYNLYHFWSNFELGSVKFLKSPEYTEYFEHLDYAGGFFYERWGDAPVHTLGAALFLKKSEVHYFEEIGYYHVPFYHCPQEPYFTERHCDCKMKESIVFSKGYSCSLEYKEYTPRPWFT